MSETHSNNGELVPSMESAIPMEPGPSVQEPRNGDSSETSASKALASIVKFLGSEEEQSVTIKDVLQHMESLSTALTVNSRLLERNFTTAAAGISPRSSGNVESQGSVPASLGTADTQNALEEPWMIETWQNGWSRTLNAIDEIVGFNMSDTFDDERLETYFFDSSSSMDLSKQYFTVLQLLRDARRRIEDNHAN
ncbi:hypothetical protein F5883DRAFT_645061 [Diaporthe sp. PMI_573]|nr:hypothetical protein F5883DRAFT_645061 [Diaporthaceae sp. PMI_573]